MEMLQLRRLTPAIAGLLALVACSRSQPGAYLTAEVERGSVRNAVDATGTLEALTTVQVGSQVTGVVEELNADYNSLVTKGQVIARIDPASFEAQLQRSEAELLSARAAIASAQAAVANNQANVEASSVALTDAGRVLARSRELSAAGVLPERELEAAEAAERAARARLDQARAQLRSAGAQLDQARAQLSESEAALRMARVNLEHTIIRSPIDGVVISRDVDVGQTVSASLSAPTLFVLAEDLTRMQVVVSVDEADIGAISDGTRVSFSVDAFARESFEGTVTQVRLRPITTQNVVTYQVIVRVSNSDLKLRPGMTANVTFVVASAEDVLRVPNAALRFWPEGVAREDLMRSLGLEAPAVAEKSSAPELSPEGRQLLAELEAAASRDERRALFAKVRELPEPDRERLRAIMAERRGEGSARDGRQAQSAAQPLEASGGVLRIPPRPEPAPEPAVVWRLAAGKPEPVRILAGITDGSHTAATSSELEPGAELIVGRTIAPDADRSRPQANSPLSGRPNVPRR